MRIEELNEDLYFAGLERDQRAMRQLGAIIERHPKLHHYNGETIGRGDAVIKFGGQLSNERNVVTVGNKYYNKQRQANILQGVVPMPATVFDPSQIDTTQGYVAKPVRGERQQGLLIDELPDDPTDYIFQPKLDIINEYRVITYHMNGDYHVAGIYKKTGMNVSLSSIPVDSPIGRAISQVALRATEALGYGLSGADVALVPTSDYSKLSENMLARAASAAMRVSGRMQNLSVDGKMPVIIEVNSKPSMANPAIMQDLVRSILSNSI